MTQVLIIDDHPIVLTGCRRILEDAGISDCHACQDFRNGYRLYTRIKPDLIIVDLAVESDSLGGLSFIKNLRVHDARTPVLVFSMHSDPFIVRLALEAGATGYLLKDTTPEEFINAFEKVRKGLPYLCPEIAAEIVIKGGRANTSPLADVSQREAQTLALLAKGYSYSAIASELNVSYKTIANTGAQLKARFGAATLPDLIRLAMHYLSGARN